MDEGVFIGDWVCIMGPLPGLSFMFAGLSRRGFGLARR